MGTPVATVSRAGACRGQAGVIERSGAQVVENPAHFCDRVPSLGADPAEQLRRRRLVAAGERGLQRLQPEADTGQ